MGFTLSKIFHELPESDEMYSSDLNNSGLDGGNPDMQNEESHDAYAYKPLAENEIRLLRCSFEPKISLQLQHYVLHPEQHYLTEQYRTLSYCWGDANDLCNIPVEGNCYLRVTRRLQTTLQQINQHYPELSTKLWWIDQICIDQDNVKERNDQVHRMWQIFSAARHVYAWIGEGTGFHTCAAVQTGSAQNLMQSGLSSTPPIDRSNKDEVRPQVSVRRRRTRVVADILPERRDAMLVDARARSGWTEDQGFHVDKELTQDVMAMLDQPYFSRTWIVPEMLQASDLTFLYGSRHCLADYLDASLDILFRSGWKWDVQKLVKVKQILEMRREKPWQRREVSKRASFLDALELLHETECADIRDKVFAALSIPGLATRKTRDGLQPDYRLTRGEIAVLAIAYYDKLDGSPRDMRRLSRTLARSLMLGDGTNITAVYQNDVAAAVLSCTKPWVEGEQLFLQSGLKIGQPGPCMQLYLSEAARGYH